MLTISLEHDSISFSIEIWIHHIKVSNYFQNLMGTRTSECTQLSQIFLISVYLLNSNQVPTQNVTFCFVFKDHKTNTSRQTDRPTQKPPQCTKSAIEHNQRHKFMPPLIAKQMKRPGFRRSQSHTCPQIDFWQHLSIYSLCTFWPFPDNSNLLWHLPFSFVDCW